MRSDELGEMCAALPLPRAPANQSGVTTDLAIRFENVLCYGRAVL